MATFIPNDRPDLYEHCKAQMQRQIPERDALNEVIEDITAAIEDYERRNPPVVPNEET